MNGEDGVQEAEFATLNTALLDLLHECQRTAFVLVREDDVTYKVAGDVLGLTPLAICKHVASAQRVFRKHLSNAGIPVTRRRPATHRHRL